MNLFDELQNAMKDENKFGRDVSPVMLPTGFDCFDFMNGTTVLNADGSTKITKGIDAGKLVTVIGKSGSGKTTFAIQSAYNLIKPYEQGTMFILDFEQSSDARRIQSITGMSSEEFKRRVGIKKVGISTETVLDTVVAIKNIKKQNEKALLVDSGEVDADGNPVKILPPTVVVIDSIAMMFPKESLESEEMQGQMSATAAAKANTQLFKRLVQPCIDGNIICFFINHINQKVSTSVMPTQAQVNYLGQDETLPGGNAPIYLTNTLIRITTATKLEEDKLFKIKGFMTKIQLVKSRTAPAGSSVNLVYNQSEGFDNILSNLQFLKDNGKVLGAGIGMYLLGYPDVKFSFANFKEKLELNSSFKKYFEELSAETLSTLVRKSSKLSIGELEEEIPVLEEE